MGKYHATVDEAANTAIIWSECGSQVSKPIIRFANETDSRSLAGHVLLQENSAKQVWWKIAPK